MIALLCVPCCYCCLDTAAQVQSPFCCQTTTLCCHEPFQLITQDAQSFLLPCNLIRDADQSPKHGEQQAAVLLRAPAGWVKNRMPAWAVAACVLAA